LNLASIVTDMHQKLNKGFYNSKQLQKLGFKSVGENVLIAKDAIVIGFENISIGSNVKIDSNVTLAASGGYLIIGNWIHIGGSSHLSCSGGIVLNDFVTISQGVKIYSASDDYSGNTLTNPTVSETYKNVQREPVMIEKHVIIGSNSVVAPGTILEIGVAIGALSFAKGRLQAWNIYGGNPIKRLKSRSTNLLEIEKVLKKDLGLDF
jgi:acetyltransferase-like isoleucine patch superfamily enzyme